MKLDVIFVFLLAVGVTIAYLDIEVQRFQQLSESIVIDYTKLKVRKINGTRKLIGNITVNQPLDNTFKMEIFAFIKQGGEYRQLPYKLMRKPFCDFFREDTMFYEEACEYSDFVYPPPCPLEVGTYGVHGFHPTYQTVPRMILHTGDYAIELAVYDEHNKQVFRGRVFGSIIHY